MGTTSVHPIGAHTLEYRAEGHGSRVDVLEALERCDALLREQPTLWSLMFNLEAHVSHDPGNTAVAVRWFAEHRDRMRRAAIVTRSHSLATLSNVARVMLPWLEVAVFTSREAALAWCDAAEAPDRAQTARRTKAGRGRRSDAA